MSAIAEDTQLFCNICSDPVEGENFGSESYPVGRCCNNLPEPWTRDREGYYTSDDGEDYDDDVDDRPSCSSCGSHSFQAYGSFTQRVQGYINAYGDNDSYDDSTLWISGYSGDVTVTETETTEDFELGRVECRDCGTRYRGNVEFN
jgi:hypothetical protein